MLMSYMGHLLPYLIFSAIFFGIYKKGGKLLEKLVKPVRKKFECKDKKWEIGGKNYDLDHFTVKNQAGHKLSCTFIQ